MSECVASEQGTVADTGRTIDEQQAGGGERKGRDGRGRFLPGNSGGPGNPFGRRVAALRKTLLDAVTDEQIRDIGLKMIELAQAGDVAAAKLVFQYTLGRPAETVDPDRVEVDEWRLAQESAIPLMVWGQIFEHLPADLANTLARTIWPCRTAQIAEKLHEQLNPPGRPDGTKATGRQGAPASDSGQPSVGNSSSSTGGKGTPARRSSAGNGGNGERGAPSPAGTNGDADRAAARRARDARRSRASERRRAEPAAGLVGDGDDERQWRARVLAEMNDRVAREAGGRPIAIVPAAEPQ